MAEYSKDYNGKYERNILAEEARLAGYRLLHDNFFASWKRGEPPAGTLTFTNGSEKIQPKRATKLDELEARITALERIKPIL